MPNTAETSEQYESLTTSSGGRNVMPLLQPKSHFFLEDSNFSQSEPQRFGAISQDQFNTTSKLTFSGTKKIYALCQGTVFIQPQTGAGNEDKVNLILRPFRQPISNIPIKYIIYRGLNKSDFVTNSGQVAGSETTGTGFVKYIWSEFLQFYGTDGVNESAPDFMANFIGFPHTTDQLTAQDSTHLIDQYFFKIATVLDEATGEEEPTEAFEFPLIPRGIHLGNATGEIGIDIVLNRGDYYIENDPNPFKLDLAFARAENYSLNASTITDNFQKKLYKENATAFLDVAALYGLHANGAGKLYVAENATPLTTKDAIYGMLNGFYSKNKIYLYIQANRQRSYNFYDNYVVSGTNPNNMKIGVDTANLSETTFGTFEWPIHETTTTVSDPAETTSFTFQLTTDNYADASMYVQLGSVASEHEENFIRDKNLLQQDPEVDQTFTQDIVVNVNATTSNVIASYVNVLCEVREMIVEAYVPANDPTADPQDVVIKDIDDVFGLLDASIANTLTSDVQLPTIVDEKLQIINFSIVSEKSDVGVVKHQKVTDRIQLGEEDDSFINRVTYETLIDTINRKISSYRQNSASNLDNAKTSVNSYSGGQYQSYQPKLPHYYDITPFTDGDDSVRGLTLKVLESDSSVKRILGIIDSENQRLKDALQVNNLLNAKIFFMQSNYNNSNEFLSPEEIEYNIYELLIVGENSQGDLELHQPVIQTGETEYKPVEVYTIDGKAIFSKEYSKHQRDIYGGLSYTNLEI
ncbi:MAG: hypothetical protein AB8H03_20045 [Saprospiraceae bacterium]